MTLGDWLWRILQQGNDIFFPVPYSVVNHWPKVPIFANAVHNLNFHLFIIVHCQNNSRIWPAVIPYDAALWHQTFIYDIDFDECLLFRYFPRPIGCLIWAGWLLSACLWGLKWKRVGNFWRDKMQSLLIIMRKSYWLILVTHVFEMRILWWSAVLCITGIQQALNKNWMWPSRAFLVSNKSHRKCAQVSLPQLGMWQQLVQNSQTAGFWQKQDSTLCRTSPGWIVTTWKKN